MRRADSKKSGGLQGSDPRGKLVSKVEVGNFPEALGERGCLL